MTLVLASNPWLDNGALIADVARLHLRPNDIVLDVTYGRGVWWSTFMPDALVTHDLKIDGVDFRDLPHPDASFDVVAFDPPYVSIGGRKPSKLADMHDRFGMATTPHSPAELQQLIDAGMTEAARVSERLILAKCQNYTSSGKFFPGVHYTLAHALAIGCVCIDQFHLTVPSPRAQPTGRTRKGPNGTRIPTVQQHARVNVSTLFVLGVPKRKSS